MSQSDPFNIGVNGRFTFDVQPADVQHLDLVAQPDGSHHLLLNGKAYRIETLDAHYPSRTFTFRINGNRYHVHVADHYERLVQRLGLHTGGAQRINAVKAPMPGLVLNIVAEPGQEVQQGDPLLILEAMKMENVLKAAGDGRVKAVKVNKGQPVDKGMLLIEME
jgi:biotin carboxyl carrier protein